MPIIGQISVGDGATFTPSVDSNGVISWTNNKNLTNPASVDIPQAVVYRYQLAPTSNPTFTGTVTAEDITASGTITGDLTGTASGNLPLSGGTMTGSILFNASNPSIVGNVTTGRIGILSGSNIFDGSTLQLFGRNDSSYAGRFYLRASTKSSADSSGSEKSLVGSADGSLTWGGNDITPQQLTTENMEDKSVPSGTITSLGTISLTRGTWLIHFLASFSSNASGYRRIGISNSTSAIGIGRFWYLASPPANGNETRLSLTTFATVSGNTTYYCNVHQTSGSTLTCGGGAQIFRLSPMV